MNLNTFRGMPPKRPNEGEWRRAKKRKKFVQAESRTGNAWRSSKTFLFHSSCARAIFTESENEPRSGRSFLCLFLREWKWKVLRDARKGKKLTLPVDQVKFSFDPLRCLIRFELFFLFISTNLIATFFLVSAQCKKILLRFTSTVVHFCTKKTPKKSCSRQFMVMYRRMT